MPVEPNPKVPPHTPPEVPVRIPEDLVLQAYDRLRDMAHGRLRHEGRKHLQTTELVHEAYLRLARENKSGWTQRQFLGAAAEAMRRILVEQARARAAGKRGGNRQRIPLDQAQPEIEPPSLDIPALDEAMDQLRAEDPRLHEVVMLRYFGGLDIGQVAEVLQLSSRTVDRDWSLARLWLLERIADNSGGERER